MNNPSQRKPKKREVWYVKDLWVKKAEFIKCAKAESSLRHLDKHDGFVCVPFKSRPVIIFKDWGDGMFSVCRCSRLNIDGSVRPGRVNIGDIGLGKKTSLYLEPPRQFHRNFFGEYRCEAPREVCLYVWGKMKWVLLRGVPSLKEPNEERDRFDDHFNEAMDITSI